MPTPPMPAPRTQPRTAAIRTAAAVRRRHGGFTLLEALIAFAIAALALVALYDGAVTGLADARAAVRTTQAVALARSRLEAARGMAPAAMAQTMMVQTGEEQGLHWQVRITPAATARLADAQATLYEIAVVVSWGDRHGQQVRLDGTRVGLVPTAP